MAKVVLVKKGTVLSREKEREKERNKDINIKVKETDVQNLVKVWRNERRIDAARAARFPVGRSAFDSLFVGGKA